jgi:hypothetical protein
MPINPPRKCPKLKAFVTYYSPLFWDEMRAITNAATIFLNIVCENACINMYNVWHTAVETT